MVVPTRAVRRAWGLGRVVVVVLSAPTSDGALARPAAAQTLDSHRLPDGAQSHAVALLESRLRGPFRLMVRALPGELSVGDTGGISERAPGRHPWAAPRPQIAEPRRVAPVLLSLAVPGVGQRVMGQRRGWVYLSLEVVGWAFWLDRRMAGADYRDRYRDLAWEVARIPSGPRADGAFPYYETLSDWPRSGDYDSDASTSGLQPEGDPTTYNGAIWARAVDLFLPGGAVVSESDPAYQSALAYYGDRAYGTEFLWDWTGEDGARSEFGDLIVESDDRFRQATNVVGAVIANHLVSAVDAYLSARGRSVPVEIRAAPGPRAGRSRWSVRVRLEAPR
jgi:hypothetical protein